MDTVFRSALNVQPMRRLESGLSTTFPDREKGLDPSPAAAKVLRDGEEAGEADGMSASDSEVEGLLEGEGEGEPDAPRTALEAT
jgi:hypothetical protein